MTRSRVCVVLSLLPLLLFVQLGAADNAFDSASDAALGAAVARSSRGLLIIPAETPVTNPGGLMEPYNLSVTKTSLVAQTSQAKTSPDNVRRMLSEFAGSLSAAHSSGSGTALAGSLADASGPDGSALAGSLAAAHGDESTAISGSLAGDLPSLPFPRPGRKLQDAFSASLSAAHSDGSGTALAGSLAGASGSDPAFAGSLAAAHGDDSTAISGSLAGDLPFPLPGRKLQDAFSGSLAAAHSDGLDPSVLAGALAGASGDGSLALSGALAGGLPSLLPSGRKLQQGDIIAGGPIDITLFRDDAIDAEGTTGRKLQQGDFIAGGPIDITLYRDDAGGRKLREETIAASLAAAKGEGSGSGLPKLPSLPFPNRKLQALILPQGIAAGPLGVNAGEINDDKAGGRKLLQA